jgi:FkbM family methyltransferase
MLERLMFWYGRLPPRLQAWLRHWIVVPGKRLLSRGVIVQDGFVLARSLDQSTPFRLVRDKHYEPHVSALLRQYLYPGDTFIDVGANVGYFTLLGASRVGPAGRVHSFEPNPRTFRELQRNAALNRFHWVSLNNLAVSNQSGIVQLWVGSEIDSGLASMRQTSELLSETIICRSTTLDDYVAHQQLGKIRAIKLDIEGAELLALQGAQGMLRGDCRPDLVVCEMAQSLAAAFEISLISVLRFLAEKGYQLYALSARSDLSYEITALRAAEMPPDGTLVAVREGFTL